MSLFIPHSMISLIYIAREFLKKSLKFIREAYIALGLCAYPDKNGVLITRNESVNIHILKKMRGEENLTTPNDTLTDDSLNKRQELGEEPPIATSTTLTDDSLSKRQELGEETLMTTSTTLTDDSLNKREEFGEERLVTPSDVLKDDILDEQQEFDVLITSLVALKVTPDDEQMDKFLAECKQGIKGENMEERRESLNHQIAKMQRVIGGLNSPENIEIKELIKKFDTGNKLWTIGMEKKARKIEASLMSVPIEERAKLLQSKHPSVTSVLEAIASHRISIFTKTTNEKGQVIADNSANTFKEFKEKFSTLITAREDVALEKDEENQHHMKH